MSTQSKVKNKMITIKSNKEIAKDTYEMILTGDDFTCCNYGQFINIKVTSGFLRRPISICDFNQTELIITYKAVGCGTKELASLKPETEIDVLYPLGMGFSLPPEGTKDVVLVGGGIGTPPLVGFSKFLESTGNYNVKTICGFSDQSQMIYEDKFNDFTPVFDTDGDNVVSYMQKNKIKVDYFYSCGPMGMLKALANNYQEGQLLLEERMGCGFGACMGCSVKTKENEYKRVCVEGPMFYASEVRDA